MLINFFLLCIVLVTFVGATKDPNPKVEIRNIGFYTPTSWERLVLYVNYFWLALHRPCNFCPARRLSYGSAFVGKGNLPALLRGLPLDFSGFGPFWGFCARIFWKFFPAVVAEAAKRFRLGTASRARSTYVDEPMSWTNLCYVVPHYIGRSTYVWTSLHRYLLDIGCVASRQEVTTRPMSRSYHTSTYVGMYL